MYGSGVTVHTCFSQSLGNPQPVKCNCKKEVSYDEAKRLVKIGEADWLVVFKKKAKHGFPTSRAIVMESCKKTPRAQTFEKAHIERAVEGDADEKTRLETLPELIKAEFWTPLFHGVILRKNKVVGGEPIAIRDPFEGRAILIMWDDERTSHGRNSNIDKSWDDIIVLEQNEGLETALKATGGFRIRKESA